MDDYVTKSVPVFLSPTDERQFEERLKAKHPEVLFINGIIWESSAPPAVSTLEECRPGTVLLWERSVFPNLQGSESHGRIRGPVTVYVVRYIRSRVQNGLLTSGDVGVGYHKLNAPMATFVADTWKILRSLNRGILDCYDVATGLTIKSGIKNYIVGEGAIELSQAGMPLKHFLTDVYYRARERASKK